MKKKTVSLYIRLFLGILVVLVLSQTPGIPKILLASETLNWLTATDAVRGDYFGRSVSISGDTIVVGAYGSYYGGAAYIFVRNGSSWVEQAKLRPSDGTAVDFFGYSVSISGDTALVGAYQSNQNTGAAYIFVRSGPGYWTEQAKLTASDGAAGDWFGFDVSISGDTALVGAYHSNHDNGSAYIFERSGSNWAQQARLTSSDGVTGDGFGSSVSIDGNVALIGAYRSNEDRGAAYVFECSVSGWTQQAKLTAGDRAAGDWFGADVSIDGNTALIGAYHSNQDRGAAYVFERSVSGWTQQAKLTASNVVAGDFFGYSVSISRDTALVGAYQSNQNTGAAYVFVRSGARWTQSYGFTPTDSLMPLEWFGYSVSVNEDTIVVGAPRKNERGAVYLDTNPNYIFSSVMPTFRLPVNTAAATSITTTSATLNGNLTSLGNATTVNVYFEYGTNTLYGSQTPAQGMSATGTFSANITGLTAGTTYHFRAKADANAMGVSFGPDMIFTTLPPLLTSSSPTSQPPSSQSLPEAQHPFYVWLKINHRLIIAGMVIATGAGILILNMKSKARRNRINPPTKSVTSRPDYAVPLKRLEKLIVLRKGGVISDEEYAMQKSEVMKEMRGSG